MKSKLVNILNLVSILFILSFPFFSGCGEIELDNIVLGGGNSGPGAYEIDFGPGVLEADSAIVLSADSLIFYGHFKPGGSYKINTLLSVTEFGFHTIFFNNDTLSNNDFPAMKNVDWQFDKMDTTIYISRKIKKLKTNGKPLNYQVYLILSDNWGKRTYSGIYKTIVY